MTRSTKHHAAHRRAHLGGGRLCARHFGQRSGVPQDSRKRLFDPFFPPRNRAGFRAWPVHQPGKSIQNVWHYFFKMQRMRSACFIVKLPADRPGTSKIMNRMPPPHAH